MRMHMIYGFLLCKNHLSGEHFEIHKHRHVFVKKWSIDKRITPEDVQIEPMSMKQRHDELAAELLRRGGTHKSPYEMPNISHLPPHQRFATVDRWASVIRLYYKCPKCRRRIHDWYYNGIIYAKDPHV